jgi:hypothetical protein
MGVNPQISKKEMGNVHMDKKKRVNNLTSVVKPINKRKLD